MHRLGEDKLIMLSFTGSSRNQRPQTVCADCLFKRSSHRSYAVAAESLKTLDPAPNSSLPHLKTTPPISSTPSAGYTTQAGILLSRAPLLTAPQSPFEKAFFFYQKRLNERLVMPFTRYFYFKKDTPADTDWKIKAKERNGVPARELGAYKAYGDESWNDELLSTDAEIGQEGKDMGKLGLSEPKWMMESLVRDAKVRAVEGKDGLAVAVEEGMEDAKDLVVEKPLSRYSEADRMRNEKRLDRQMTRTLYLVVKRGGHWMFPAGDLVGRENLHQVCTTLWGCHASQLGSPQNCSTVG